MDSEGEGDNSKNETVTEYNMKWSHVKQFHHRYLLDVPNSYQKEFDCSAELPYPIFTPVDVTNHRLYREMFKPKMKPDTCLTYYKKLYAKEDKRNLKRSLKNKYALLPQYIIDIAEGKFDEYDDPSWCFTGGTLTCFSINNRTYIARSGFNQAIHITQLDCPNLNSDIEVNERGPVYSLKSSPHNEGILLAVRQKHDVSLLYLINNRKKLKEYNFWSTKSTKHSFVDVTFNEFTSTEFSIIDDVHKLLEIDVNAGKLRLDYDFPFDSNTTSDPLAQIIYIDSNTVCYMNRCSIHLLDVRSLDIKELNLDKGLFKCDDFCMVSQSAIDNNGLLVSSTHSCIHFDIRTESYVSKIKHMLSNPPFLSSSIQTTTDSECISLFGQNARDRIIVCNSNKGLTLPLYVSNPKDSLTAASLKYEIQPRDELKDRMSSPPLGLKFYKENDDIFLYNVSTIGDVFKQKLLRTNSEDLARNLEVLQEWSTSLFYKPKKLEATSVCNLGHVMSTITSRIPRGKVLENFTKESQTSSKKLFETKFSNLGKCLEGTVGETMNSIWDDEAIIEEEAGVSSAISSKQKVSAWLSNVM